MNDKLREDIAGFMDGELPRDRSRFAMRRLAQDDELRDHWQRMHLVRSYLRDGHTCSVPDSFLAGIQEQLGDVESVKGISMHRWIKPLASTAVAASVAVLALVGINQNVLDQGDLVQPLAVTANAPADVTEDQGFVARSSFLERQFTAPVVPVNFTNDPQETRQRLNDYLLRHNQLSGNGGRFGFVSYMPLVSSQIENEKLADTDVVNGKVPVESAIVPATAAQDSSKQ